MKEEKPNNFLEFIYKFFVDVFNDGIIGFIKKMFMIGIGIILGVMIFLFGLWIIFRKSETYETNHLLKPEMKIEENDTIYIYHLN